MTVLSVVVPAHDEEVLIADAVRAIAADGIDLIVVANGCTDATAQRARAAGVPVRVIEVAEASKVRALNAGNAAADVSPVAFVDADVTVSGADLLALARRFEAHPEAKVGAPTMRLEPSSSWWVRQHYRVWELTGYRSDRHVGSGIYMLTAEGRSRIPEFPDLIADDLLVQQLFSVEERLVPEDLTFSVLAPGTLAALVKRNTRIVAGNRQFAQRYPELAPPSTGAGARTLLARLWWRPMRWPGLAVYVGVSAASRLGAWRVRRRGGAVQWNTDVTTRSAA
ncbi:glycosyltransferase family 2 protein [uncultured Demequina sp.]|uniref:glycosyltransferase family 2 protein n=1 Tax=uncultured Demequina sp. TaxID=693499 RepID=UPI0025F25292|nr:glycosyltransferase family 2 protein [uncultured Demequina sp.]